MPSVAKKPLPNKRFPATHPLDIQLQFQKRLKERIELLAMAFEQSNANHKLNASLEMCLCKDTLLCLGKIVCECIFLSSKIACM